MSRTYRRLKNNFPGMLWGKWIETDREYYHLFTDKHRAWCGDLGPRWFKRMTHTIRDRRYTQRELYKYLKDPDHETMCNISYQNKEYWS